jgi:hypothetical protein
MRVGAVGPVGVVQAGIAADEVIAGGEQVGLVAVIAGEADVPVFEARIGDEVGGACRAGGRQQEDCGSC